MNFPDLDTCKAIAGEFPESEFVYLEYFSEVMEVERDKAGELIENYKREYGYSDNANRVKILAPAPVCEELGDWLFDKGTEFKEPSKFSEKPAYNDAFVVTSSYEFSPDRNRVYHLHRYYETFCSGNSITIKAPSETQARAEATKLILESRK